MIEQINAGVCQDITSAIAEGGFKDTFYPAGVQNFTYQGKTYGLPTDIGPMVFWYNKDLFEKRELTRQRSRLGTISLRR